VKAVNFGDSKQPPVCCWESPPCVCRNHPLCV